MILQPKQRQTFLSRRVRPASLDEYFSSELFEVFMECTSEEAGALEEICIRANIFWRCLFCNELGHRVETFCLECGEIRGELPNHEF